MCRIAIIWGLLLVGIGCLPALCAQDIVPASHGLRGEPVCPEPQRIVVKLPPPRVELKDNCRECEPAKKCCLFLHRHKSDSSRSDSPRNFAPAGEMLWAPASLPTMVMQAPQAAPVMTHTQQITHDFSSLRHAQELEIHAAGMAAHLAARNAMINAENDALQRIMERTQKRIESVCTTVAPSPPQPNVTTDKTDGKQVNLDIALKNLNTRLDRLEELVLLHQQAINALKQNPNPKTP